MNAFVKGDIVQRRRLRVEKKGVYKRLILFVTLADILTKRPRTGTERTT